MGTVVAAVRIAPYRVCCFCCCWHLETCVVLTVNIVMLSFIVVAFSIGPLAVFSAVAAAVVVVVVIAAATAAASDPNNWLRLVAVDYAVIDIIDRLLVGAIGLT
eukprot:scaffold444391_cov26-Prasinocladus_malaysianus.AAC.1